MPPYKRKTSDGIRVWLQYYGYCQAKPATEFAVGDIRAYNNGHWAKITKIVEKSKTMLTFTIVDDDGGEYTEDVRKTTLKPYFDRLATKGRYTYGIQKGK